MEYTKIESYIFSDQLDTRVSLIPSARIVKIDPLTPTTDPNYRDSFTGQDNEGVRRQNLFDALGRNPHARTVMFVDEGQGQSGMLVRYYMPQCLDEIARRAPGLMSLTNAASDAPPIVEGDDKAPVRGAGPARAGPNRGPAVTREP